jgi:putative SOS response-associated peptidase YedK
LSARWGFVPHWWKQAKLPAMTNNARIEGAATKPMWRHPWRHSRCLIPVTHWYEWQEIAAEGQVAGESEKKAAVGKPRKLPYAMSSKDGTGFMFAGLWSLWTPPTGGDPIATVAVVTRDASDSVSHVHDRMPVIVHPRAWTRWLSVDVTEYEQVAEILAVNTVLEAKTWRVTPKMSKPQFSGPECLDPV